MNFVEYDELEFQKKYDELSKYTVIIPDNLMSLGYDEMSKLFTTVQGYMNRVSEIISEVTLRHGKTKAIYESLKSAYEAEYDALLSQETQKEYESIKVVESRVRSSLGDKYSQVQNAKLNSSLYGAFLRMARGRYSNLEKIQKTLEEQTNIYKRLHPPRMLM